MIMMLNVSVFFIGCFLGGGHLGGGGHLKEIMVTKLRSLVMWVQTMVLGYDRKAFLTSLLEYSRLLIENGLNVCYIGAIYTRKEL